MAIINLNDDNKIPVYLIGGSIFVAVIVVVWFFNNAAYSSLVLGSGLYAFLGVITLGFYTNNDMQDYLIGIQKSWKTFVWIGAGVGVAILMLVLAKAGLSMGIPLIPQTVATSVRWIIIVVFAPIFEDSLRFALLGFILFMTRKCNQNSCGINKKWLFVAIAAQSAFFVILHFSAYATGFYTAPTFLASLTGLSAVSASLLAAGIFSFLTGWLCTLDGVRNYALSVAAHLVFNGLLFVSLAVVGLHII